MIGAVSAYIKNIVGLIIMTALAEMIIPHGKLKKYVRFVMGLIITASVTEPMVRLVWGRGYDFNMDINDIYAYEYNREQETQRKMAEDIYKEETEKICIETAGAMDIETAEIILDTDNTDGIRAEVYVKKPHICITAAAGFNGDRKQCDICTEKSEKLRQALILKTGIEDIKVSIFED